MVGRAFIKFAIAFFAALLALRGFFGTGPTSSSDVVTDNTTITQPIPGGVYLGDGGSSSGTTDTGDSGSWLDSGSSGTTDNGDSGGWWDSGSSGDSGSWDSGGDSGSWDSGGWDSGGDSGSWDSGGWDSGGDSGSW